MTCRDVLINIFEEYNINQEDYNLYVEDDGIKEILHLKNKEESILKITLTSEEASSKDGVCQAFIKYLVKQQLKTV